MKILIIAGDGFMGHSIRVFLSRWHTVYSTSRKKSLDPRVVYMDLEKPETIKRALIEVEPEIVINCAGIVDQSKDTNLNVVFTTNLLEAIAGLKKKPERIIISGSAAEYGYVQASQIPVKETTPLSASQGYGLSKLKEEEVALELASKYDLPVVVARVFNPIGTGMHSRFLISNILRQIAECSDGSRDYIELSRLDSKRDYVSVLDIASAFGAIAEGSPSHLVYNIGSGKSTTNRELADLILKRLKLNNKLHLRETSDIVEPLVAVQADIQRLNSDLNWYPQTTLEDTIGEIIMQDQVSRINIVIVGAGKAGELVANNIREHAESGLNIVGFVDDDRSKQAKIISSIPVLGGLADLKKLVVEHAIDELYIAIPSQRGKTIRSIVESTMGLKLVYKILPRISEVLLQDYDSDFLKRIRRVQAEDLLGGEILKSDQTEISDYAKDQTILITGAAGSIGSELSRQVVAHGAARVVLYDWWENGIFELRNQLIENYPDADITYVIGNVNDRKRLDQVVSKFRPATIFHAAAYKHVPLMEGNPTEAIKNNIVGTKTVAEVAIKYAVKKFILVSTDKAVNPTNIMGATKRAAEKMVHILSQSQSVTTFCVVRFGNVINSNGSAIPFFERQIEKGGPVTITHRDVTRFFMTIPEAVHLILQSWVMGENNDLFVLDMGESIKIYDLAKLLITLRGYVPEEEIKLTIIGLRPGEKLYEEVLVKEEETISTAVEKVFRTQNYLIFNKLAFLNNLNLLIESIEEDSLDIAGIKTQMGLLVSTYKPSRKQGGARVHADTPLVRIGTSKVLK